MGRVGPLGSLPRPEPRVVTGGGNDRRGNGAGTDGRQTYSTDPGRREVDIGGEGFSQRHSCLHSDVETAMGGSHSEVERVYPPTSTLPIPSSEKFDGV